MPICDFAYHRPQSIAEACELARDLGEDAIFLAGGTEIVPDFKRGRETAEHLISLADISGLAEIRDAGEFLIIGAMARLESIAASSAVRQAFPVLAEAASTIGGYSSFVSTTGASSCVPAAWSGRVTQLCGQRVAHHMLLVLSSSSLHHMEGGCGTSVAGTGG